MIRPYQSGQKAMRDRRRLSQWVPIILLCAGTALAQTENSLCLNEFLASNGTVLANEAGQYDDWIELYNGGSSAINLAGMFLTDDREDPARWPIPSDRPDVTVIPPGGYALVWADGTTDGAGLHANFKLSSDGEEIALYDTDGVTLIDHVVFGEQSGDVSFGRCPDGGSDWAFMTAPTPGAANAEAYAGIVEAVTFSVAHGFFTEPFTVTLATATPEAQIWYTLDGTTPSGDSDESPSAVRYDQPIPVDGATVIRAVATKPGWKDSSLTARTYLFAADTQVQLYPPEEPDPDIRHRYGGDEPSDTTEEPEDESLDPALEAALQAIPSVSLVIEPNDFFDSEIGIDANPSERGVEWERPVSVEWVDPNGAVSFQVNAGLRIHGGASRRSSSKHSLRMLFKTQYGPPTLDVALFDDTDVHCFNSLVLRGTLHDSFSLGTARGSEETAQYLRDQFSRDTMRDMGRLTPYGCPVHVYVNGQYWGLYILVERPDDGFAAAHLGGDKDQYDALKARSVSDTDTSPVEVVAGDLEAWDTLFELAGAGLEGQARYEQACAYVDVPALIDYMLMVFYVGSTDGPVGLGDQTPRNFWVVRPREAPGGFVFLAWDLEFSLDSLSTNRTTVTGTDNPHCLFHLLATNADFRVHVMDRIYANFFGDGTLTPSRVAERYLSRASGVEQAVLPEAARWNAEEQPAVAEALVHGWRNERDRLLETYFPARTDVVIGQLRDAGFYPATEPPRLEIDGLEQSSGVTYAGASLTLVNPNDGGTIYYTTDGTDPRLFGQIPDANELVTLVDVHAQKHVFVPNEDIGTDWTGGMEPYDDADWTAGTPVKPNGGAVGYRSARHGDPRISYDIAGAMANRTSCCIRIAFDVNEADVPNLSHLALRVLCDDGFVAYLNGVEVASLNQPDPLTWDARCADRPESDESIWLGIPAGSELLLPGSNILAVHAFDNDSDGLFLFSVEVFASDHAFASGHIASSAQRYVEPIPLTESRRIKARVWNDGLWSPLADAVFAVEPVRENLRFTEIMYHPAQADEEFIELANIGTEPLNLNMVRLTGGIDFVFPSLDLAPLEVTLLVRDREAFEDHYGVALPVAGQYEGALDNAGDSIELLDALGRTIQEIRYDDDWYPQTDGEGCSLTCPAPWTVDPNACSSAAFWSPSSQTGGSPGTLAD